jgi:hypothetical protein
MTEGGRSLWELYHSEVPPWKRGRTILACIALSHFVLQCLLALAFVLDGSAVRVCAFGFAAVIFWLLFYFVWIGVAWLRWLWGVWNLATGFCLLIWAWRDLSELETLFGHEYGHRSLSLFAVGLFFCQAPKGNYALERSAALRRRMLPDHVQCRCGRSRFLVLS